LKASKKIGVGQLAMRGQEYVVALKPCGKGLLLETLRYADEVNKAQSYFREIGDTKPDADLLDMASMLIERKAGKFDPKEFHNRYVDALHRLIEEKQKAKGEKIIEDPDANAPPPKGSNVVDLMAALKRSLGDEGGGKAANENKRGAAKKAAPKKAAPRHAPKKAPAKKAAGGRRR
jgi:DNA end-binding protein Ku